MDENQIKEIVKEAVEKAFKEKIRTLPLHQSQLLPKVVKNRHIDGVIIETGTATNRPDGSSQVKAWFSTDTNLFSLWDGVEWVGFARIPASLSTYTQTYSTADKTHANSTFAAVSETAATQTTPWGYGSAAQADAIIVELNDLGDDVIDLKQLVNSLIDDLQSIGLIA